MRAFVECRIKPYYLHHADLAPGTSHFRTSIEEGQALMRALRGRVSGLAQPAYVLDIPGGHGKVPVGPGYIDMCGEAGAVVEDINGRRHTVLGHRLRRLRRHARRPLLHQVRHAHHVDLAGAEHGHLLQIDHLGRHHQVRGAL